MSVVIYTRCSTTAQAERHSIETQVEACRAFAKAQGLRVVEIFTDAGVSGSVAPLDRHGLAAALSLCEREGYSLLVAKLDRLSRSVIDALAVEQSLRKHGLDLYSASEPNGSTPELDLMRGIMLNFAQFERARIRERVREGLATAKAKGIHVGRPPAGFAKNDHGEWVRGEDYNRVREALALRGSGMKLRVVASLTGYADTFISRLMKRYGSAEGLDRYAEGLGL